jgi:hypothetical protein
VRSQADRAVELFPQDVGVPGVSGSFFDHVDVYPP